MDIKKITEILNQLQEKINSENSNGLIQGIAMRFAYNRNAAQAIVKLALQQDTLSELAQKVIFAKRPSSFSLKRMFKMCMTKVF